MMAQIQVPLPPLAEQQVLVTRLDALAENTRQLEAHLDAAAGPALPRYHRWCAAADDGGGGATGAA